VLYIGHKAGIKDDLTALENLRIASTLDGHSLGEDQAWQALDQVGLRGFEDLPSKHLSQGQKRRVALARLLVSKARLWILDEPFSALDSAAVTALEAVIGSHLASGGMVVLTTHQEVDLTQGQIKQLRLGAGDEGEGEGEGDV
jgi:heme exporter protein A